MRKLSLVAEKPEIFKSNYLSAIIVLKIVYRAVGSYR